MRKHRWGVGRRLDGETSGVAEAVATPPEEWGDSERKGEPEGEDEDAAGGASVGVGFEPGPVLDSEEVKVEVTEGSDGGEVEELGGAHVGKVFGLGGRGWAGGAGVGDEGAWVCDVWVEGAEEGLR